MEREEDELTSLIHKLLNQQQRLRQLHRELTVGGSQKLPLASVHSINHSESQSGRALDLDFRKKCAYNWVAGYGIDMSINRKEYSDEEIEELEVFRKTNYSECHNQGSAFLATSDSPPPRGAGGWQPQDHRPSIGLHSDDCRVENYSLNHRMFPELTSAPSNTTILDDQPQKRLLQVSIPQRTIEETRYIFKPRTRNSFDSVNTMGLTKHCLNGLKTTKYPALPTQQLLSISSSVAKKVNRSNN